MACVFSFQANAQTATIALNADEAPEKKAWSDPAQIAFTSSDGDNSWAVDAALRIDKQVAKDTPDTYFLSALVQRNTAEKGQVENYQLKGGYHIESDTIPYGAPPNTPGWYFAIDASLGIGRRTLFAGAEADCTVVPLATECADQRETSLRGAVAIEAWRMTDSGEFQSQTTFSQDPATGKLNGDTLIYSVAPIMTVFHDQVVDAKPNAAGMRATGGAFGMKFDLKAAVSPKFTAYRLILRGSVSQTEALLRSAPRRETFERSSMFLRLSADVELGKRTFEDGIGWIPSVGVSWTKGDDPLSGKRDQDVIVAGFRLSYKGK